MFHGDTAAFHKTLPRSANVTMKPHEFGSCETSLNSVLGDPMLR
jgi:hypothetical protein